MILFPFAFALAMLGTGCGGSRSEPPSPAQRMVVCDACGWTGPLEPGYLGTLEPDEISMTETGEKRFSCPECGEITAHPVAVELPKPENAP